MSLKVLVKISNEEEIFAFRRKIYTLILQLTGNLQLSATTASDISEVCRVLIQKLNPFSIEVYFDRNDSKNLLKITVICSRVNESITELIYRLGLQIRRSDNNENVILADKIYKLSSLLADAPANEILHEIVASKSREELFTEIEDRQKSLQVILDNSPVCISFESSGVFRYVNAMYKSDFGLEVGDTVESIYALSEERILVEHDLKQGRAVSNRSVILKTKKGERRPSVFTILPMVYKGESGHMAWVTDVSEQKAAEEAILSAKHAAEEATKTKSDFLANMSHEIRTPMNAIIGMSHLALQTNLDKKQRNYVQKVHRAGENLLGIINDILDFSKIEAGKMSMEAIDFNLEDVMDSLANLVGMKAEDKGIELLFKIQEDVPSFLIGDPLRLGQILINLGNNAVKFTETGEIVIAVEKVAEHAQEIELHFSVADTGIGMTLEQCSKMFQSFSQADASTTRKYGGTGLGLVISKNLVEMMDGRIWVESELGKGSCFHFQIKIGVQKGSVQRQNVKNEELLGLKVLVADDNASAREILVSMIRNLGLEVAEARDGFMALEMIKSERLGKQPFDLVLMDWQMPNMDGLQVARKLMDIPGAPAVIMVTSFGKDDAIHSAEIQKINLDLVLTKPVIQHSLLEAIRGTLKKGISNNGPRNEKDLSQAEWIRQLSGARILLAEDNEMNQELAAELLRQVGMHVTIANNGQEALDILITNPDFDGVLMDCQMPVMDGYTATREIRKLAQFAQLPIIAMTANAMAGDRKKVLDAGMWDHIAKPLNFHVMFSTIAKWIKPSTPAFQSSIENKVSIGLGKQVPLSNLRGLDIELGLGATMNNEDLYRRLLNKFYQGQKDFSEQFLAAQLDADANAATRCAHTLKGNAGNIGAKGVQLAAGALEEACTTHAAEARIQELLAKVLLELDPVISSLASLQDDLIDPASQQPSYDIVQIQLELDKLKGLLEDNDADAIECLSGILESVQGNSIRQELKHVLSHVENYDFDAALDFLKQIKTSCQ